MNGILNIDKPAGMTSHDVVYRVRKLLHMKRVGHAGTLDPDATGVLLVCLGHSTRLADLLADQGKEYEAVLRLGITTSTEDGSGEVLVTRDPSAITKADLVEILPNFIGTIQQVPPMVSALHHEGKRLYDLARQGIVVGRSARPVQIDSIELLDFSGGPSCCATMRVRCGKGTYIRTLCADIGAALGVGGHMSFLRRTAVGVFRIDTAVSLQLATSEEQLLEQITSPSDAVAFLQAYQLDDLSKADVLNGRRLNAFGLFDDDELIRLVHDGDLVALARAQVDGTLQPEKVFP
jgi:tRNA pseudouridine55 synthase